LENNYLHLKCYRFGGERRPEICSRYIQQKKARFTTDKNNPFDDLYNKLIRFEYSATNMRIPTLFVCFNPPKELHGTEIHIDRFAAIREIFYLYEMGIKKSDLQNFCKLSPEGNITDNHCDSSPCERSKQKRFVLMVHFGGPGGLSDYAPNN
jgi:hypothetical protein